MFKKYLLGLISGIFAIIIIFNFTGSVTITCAGIDDTIALQGAITAAEFTGDKVLLPSMPCKTSAPLNINEHINFSGVGYQADAGIGYWGLTQIPMQWLSFIPTLPLKGSVILPGAHDAFHITSNRAVKMADFQISYNQTAPSGLNLTAIKVAPSAGAGNFNAYSIFRDITITNADRGIELTDTMDFKIDNVNILYFWEKGIITQGNHGPSWGDSTITNSTLWGQNTSAGVCHICLYSGGGLRINNNKLNVGNGSGGVGVLIYPKLPLINGVPQQQTVEPLILTGNSIEGQAVGITIVNGNAYNGGATITEVSIHGGNIWSGVNTILVPASGSNRWLNSLTATGVNFMVVGNGQSGKSVNVLNNTETALFVGNTYALSGGGTGQGLYLGTNTYGTNVQSNNYSTGIIPAAGDLTNARIGGGSP